MSIENGECPGCAGPLILDPSKEKAVCRYCGRELIIREALQKCRIDGLADFDTLMLSAQEAMDYTCDFDRAREALLQALQLRPQDWRVLWGLYLCETAGIRYAKAHIGFVQFPDDVPEKHAEAVARYGRQALRAAPEAVKPYYEQQLMADCAELAEPTDSAPPKKEGCYIATAVYGSYHCPEVRVLRLWRDRCLKKHLFGRLFIRVYYRISPFAVRRFGDCRWFRQFWKTYLDRKIERLKAAGYSPLPHQNTL